MKSNNYNCLQNMHWEKTDFKLLFFMDFIYPLHFSLLGINKSLLKQTNQQTTPHLSLVQSIVSCINWQCD